MNSFYLRLARFFREHIGSFVLNTTPASVSTLFTVSKDSAVATLTVLLEWQQSDANEGNFESFTAIVCLPSNVNDGKIFRLFFVLAVAFVMFDLCPLEIMSTTTSTSVEGIIEYNIIHRGLCKRSNMYTPECVGSLFSLNASSNNLPATKTLSLLQ